MRFLEQIRFLSARSDPRLGFGTGIREANGVSDWSRSTTISDNNHLHYYPIQQRGNWPGQLADNGKPSLP